jgi:hypothetical protein
MAPKTQLTGPTLEIVLTAANSAAQAWYGYDQGVISGILIGSDFIKTFPQTRDTNIQGITASCFSVSPDLFTVSAQLTNNSSETLQDVSLLLSLATVLGGRIHFGLALPYLRSEPSYNFRPPRFLSSLLGE